MFKLVLITLFVLAAPWWLSVEPGGRSLVLANQLSSPKAHRLRGNKLGGVIMDEVGERLFAFNA